MSVCVPVSGLTLHFLNIFLIKKKYKFNVFDIINMSLIAGAFLSY